VGITRDVNTRFMYHCQTKDFDKMLLVESFADFETARKYEIERINELTPILNNYNLT